MDGAEILVILDGDGQHDPREIPALVKPILSGETDVVIGSRFVFSSGNTVPRYRRLGIRVITGLTNMGLSKKLRIDSFKLDV